VPNIGLRMRGVKKRRDALESKKYEYLHTLSSVCRKARKKEGRGPLTIEGLQ